MAGAPTPSTHGGAPDQRAARALYERQAETYDEHTGWALADRSRVVELLGLCAGEVVADVGCGTGLCFPDLQAGIGPGGRLIGIEPSIDMLARAGERAQEAGWGNVDLRLGSAEERLGAGDVLDAAVFCFTHDVLRSRPMLEAVLGRLRPGGRVAAVGPMWAPWWAPATNLLVWYTTCEFVTTFEGFAEPWSHLADLVPGLRVERHDIVGKYFCWGRR